MTQIISNSKRGVPTATVLQYRLPMFPVSVGSGGNVTYSGSFGDLRATIDIERGAPTTRHRDVLDAIIVSAQNKVVDVVGRIHIVFDLAEVRRALGVSCCAIDWTRLRMYLLDLQATVFSVRRPSDDWPTSYSIIDQVGDACTQAIRAPHQYGGKLKKIVLSEGYSTLLMTDTQLYINKDVVLGVLSLKHRISRNIARWMLTHSRRQHPYLQTVLLTVGAAGGERQQKTYKRQLREDAAGLEFLGIKFDGKQLFYERNLGVFISEGGGKGSVCRG